MPMKRNRHKWTNDPGTEKYFEDTYRVEKCVKCGLLKLHEYKGGTFSLGYVMEGRMREKMPECIEIKVLKV